MNGLLRPILGAVTFNEATSRHGRLLRQLYFALSYNTMMPVNVVLALGSITPYIIYVEWHRELTLGDLGLVITLTLLSAYWYSLVYVINDLIDARKDQALGIPKLSARQVIGVPHYLTVYAAGFLGVLALIQTMWPHALLPLIGYGSMLCLLSALHSYWRAGKPLTIFMERWAKFCAPLWLTTIVTGLPETKVLLGAVLLAYPVSFTMDRAYRGYLRDRLRLQTTARFGLYAAYWFTVGLLYFGFNHFDGHALLGPLLFYISTYFTLCGLSLILAKWLPLQYLRQWYDDYTATEKRRYLAYGLVQVVVLLAGLYYLVFM